MPVWLIQILVGLALSAISTLAQQAMASKADKQGRGFRGSALTGGKVPQSFLVGTIGVAGKLEHRATWEVANGTPNAYLVDLISLGDLQITGVTGLFTNGKPVTIEGTGHVTQGYPVTEYDNGSDHLWIESFTGSQTTANSYLTGKFGSDPDRPWLSDMIGRGIPYITATALIDDALWTGFPTHMVVAQGIKLYDVRLDTTAGGSGAHRWATPSTWAFADNSFTIIYSLLRGISYSTTFMWGGQATAYQFPFTEWKAALDACDENVTLAAGGTEKRFRAGREIYVSERPADVVTELLVGANGRLTMVAGRYYPLVGVPSSAVGSFTDDDVIVTEGTTLDCFPNLDGIVNGATATYLEPSQAWEAKETSPYYRSDLETTDANRRQLQGFDLSTTFSGTQAQRVIQAAVEESRRFRRHVVPLSPAFGQYRVLEALAWTSTANAYSAKLFLITSKSELPNGNVILGLQEIDPTDHDWVPGTDERSLTYAPLIVDRPAAQAMTGWGVAPYTDTAARRFGIQVSYKGGLPDVRAVRIQIREAAGAQPVVFDSGATDYDISDADPVTRIISGSFLLPSTAYQVRGKFLPPDGSGRATNWSSWLSVTTDAVLLTVAEFDTTPPANPATPTLASVLEGDIARLNISWTANTEPDLAYYEVDIKEGAGSYITFTAPTSSFTRSVRKNTSFSVRLRAVDKLGNKSGNSTVATLTSAIDTTAPAQPTGLTASGTFSAIWLFWSQNTESDLAYYEIYELATTTPAPVAGTTATFSTRSNTFVRTNLAVSTTRSYWVRAVDTSGNRSAWSAIATATTLKIVGTDLTAGLLDITHFANSIAAPGVGAALPSFPTAYKQFYNTTDKVMYIQNAAGTAWLAQTDATLIVGELQAGQIGAGAVRARELSADAVTASKVNIGDTRNTFPDYDFIDDDYYSSAATFSFGGTGVGTRGRRFISLPASASTAEVVSDWFPVEISTEYNAEIAQNQGTAETAFTLNTYVEWGSMSSSGVVTPLSRSLVATKTNSTSSSRQNADLLSPSSARRARLVMERTGGGASIGAWGGFMLLRKTVGKLIVDGTITANKVETQFFDAYYAILGTAFITSAFIVDLDAAKIKANSVLSNTITVNGTALGTVEQRAQTRAPGLSVKINFDSFAVANDDELYIHGFDADGLPADIDGWVNYNGAKLTIAKQVVFCSDNSAVEGYLVYHPGNFTVNSLSVKVALCRVISGQWSYDNNSGWTNFTPGAGTLVIGQVSKSSTTIVNANVWADPMVPGVVGQDPAALVNAGSTKIDPGLVTVSGGTTLSDWRSGTDTTKIKGGALAANEVTANKMEIGARGVTITGIVFSVNKVTNVLSWTAGRIVYTRDDGSVGGDPDGYVLVNAGSYNFTGTVGATIAYIYWNKGSSEPSNGATVSLSASTSASTANQANTLVMATYRGASDLITSYGRTLIDGTSMVVPGTVTAISLDVVDVRASVLDVGVIYTRHLFLGDTSNKFPDPEFADLASAVLTLPTNGYYVSAVGAYGGNWSRASNNAAVAGSAYALQINGAFASTGGVLSPVFQVDVEKPINFSCYAGARDNNGQTTNCTSAVYIRWWADKARTTQIGSNVLLGSSTVSHSSLSAPNIVAQVEAPPGAAWADIYFRRNGSATTDAAVFSAPVIRTGVYTELVLDNAISDVLEDTSIAYSPWTSGGIPVVGGSTPGNSKSLIGTIPGVVVNGFPIPLGAFVKLTTGSIAVTYKYWVIMTVAISSTTYVIDIVSLGTLNAGTATFAMLRGILSAPNGTYDINLYVTTEGPTNLDPFTINSGTVFNGIGIKK